jgi:hypothetical protein
MTQRDKYADLIFLAADVQKDFSYGYNCTVIRFDGFPDNGSIRELMM